MRLDQTFDHTVTSLGIDIITAGQLFPVNLQIIDELKRQVRNSGGVLVILDASQYFGDDVIVSKTLRDYCSHHGLGYIPLYEDLMKANIRGVPTQWAHDGHFNEWGNIILAKSLYNWITEN